MDKKKEMMKKDREQITLGGKMKKIVNQMEKHEKGEIKGMKKSKKKDKK